MLLRHPKVLDRPGRGEVGPQAVKQRLGLLDHGAMVNGADPAEPLLADRLPSEEDILGGAHLGDEVEFLMDHADAQGKRFGRGAGVNLAAVDENLPLVLVVDAGENLDQG